MELREQIATGIKKSINEVAGITLGMAPSIAEAAMEAGTELQAKIVSSIGVSGALEASLVVIASNVSASKMVSKMIGVEVSDINQDVIDGMGELANILAGCMKNELAALNYLVALSLPSVILGWSNPYLAKFKESEHMTFSVMGEGITFLVCFTYVIRSLPGSHAKGFEKMGEGIPESHGGSVAAEALKKLMEKNSKSQ